MYRTKALACIFSRTMKLSLDTSCKKLKSLKNFLTFKKLKFYKFQ